MAASSGPVSILDYVENTSPTPTLSRSVLDYAVPDYAGMGTAVENATPRSVLDYVVTGGDLLDNIVHDEAYVLSGVDRRRARRNESDESDESDESEDGEGDDTGVLMTATTECECARKKKPGEPCVTGEVLEVVQRFAGAHPAAVATAKAKLGCESESCVVAHPALARLAAELGVSPATLKNELRTRFKVKGPRNSTALLSNHDIDGTLRLWAREFPDFYHCPFAMIDFKTNGDHLGDVDLREVFAGAKDAKATFGCVLNTDVSSGPGKHWVAIFADARTPSVSLEYFNSAGRPPPAAVTQWLEHQRSMLLRSSSQHGEHKKHVVETVYVTNIAHQRSQTECGLYALYYIRCRLEGRPYSAFCGERIPDAAMIKFRRHVFRDGR